MSEDIAAIAKGLSHAQKYAVRVLMPEKGRWRMCGLIFGSLRELGVVRLRRNPGGSRSCTPTPLGLALRTYLMEHSK